MTPPAGDVPGEALQRIVLADEALPHAPRYRLSLEQVVMNVSFIVLVVSIFWGVLSRYVLETPSTWVQEVSSIAFCWLTFLGAAEVQRRGKHVSVDLVTGLLPERPRVFLAAAMSLFIAVFCFYVAWLGWRETQASRSASTPMLGIPLSVLYIGLTCGFALMGMRTVQRLVVRLRTGRAVG
ncbi:MAG: TRAP transporter small permease [Acidisphaera sp.]|nr:TRAP transporter small permease [Acidisphaera sp.]